MEKIELARKALLDTIGTGVSFPCSLSGYGGGACGDGYTSDDEELYLNREELLYLISDGSEVFNGLEVKKVNVEERLCGMAEEACWPDGDEDGEGEYYDYGGESMYLDYYVEAWKKLIAKIMSGEVDESNLNKWLAYFDNRKEWEFGIDFFVKYN